MRYILDFDHTLFDTDALWAEAAKVGIANVSTPRTWDIFRVADFFYEDTIAFLSSKKKEDVTILTAWTPREGPEAEAYQRRKLEEAALDSYVSNIIMMEGDKSPYVESLYEGEPTIFLDDKAKHLELTKARCPDIMCVQIIRHNATKHIPRVERADIPVVHTLLELDAMIGTL